MPKRIRIVSDHHIGHRASVVTCPSALRPLAQGVDQVIFNGDTLELKYGTDPGHPDASLPQRSIFDEEVNQWDAESVLVTGNHDPLISDIHSVSLNDGQVFVTHGDGLFPDVAPWSSNITNLRKCAAALENGSASSGEADLHDFLAINKKVSLQAHLLDDAYNPTAWGRFKILAHQAWPPTTPFVILKCWRDMPDRAVALAARFGLTPRFIVVGHTHNPGVWRRGEQIIINLGSYFPWPGARCVDIEGDALLVRRIVKRQNRLQVGKPIARFELDAIGNADTGKFPEPKASQAAAKRTGSFFWKAS